MANGRIATAQLEMPGAGPALVLRQAAARQEHAPERGRVFVHTWPFLVRWSVGWLALLLGAGIVYRSSSDLAIALGAGCMLLSAALLRHTYGKLVERFQRAFLTQGFEPAHAAQHAREAAWRLLANEPESQKDEAPALPPIELA